MRGSRKIGVIGLGKSGMAAVRFFAKRGYPVFASDANRLDSLDPVVQELKTLKVSFESGEHTPRILESEIIILSPGARPDLPILKEARERGIEIWPEIEAAYRFCPGPIIAITGTNGKSTVAAMAGHLLNENGREARVVGNIGIPLLDELDTMTKEIWAVMEVSSFQLETIVKFRPRIACIITITQDHLNRHPDLKSYVAAKARILENQTKDDVAVLNLEDSVTRSLGVNVKGKVLWFGMGPGLEGVFWDGARIRWRQGGYTEVIAEADGFPFRGEHHRRNLLAAVSICFAAGLTFIKNGIDTLKGLPHRLEPVGEVDGVLFVDDSKGTNPDAVAAALSTFDQPVVLIAGGTDKNLDLAPMVEAAKGKVKAFVALGKDNAKVLDAFGFLSTPLRLEANDMTTAVRTAFQHAVRGDVVLLSPGCASFDLFSSAEERGERFQAGVKELLRSKIPR